MNNKIVYTTQWVARYKQKEYPHGWGFDAPIVEFAQDEDPTTVAKICREKLSNDEFECIGAIPRRCLSFESPPTTLSASIVEALEKANPYKLDNKGALGYRNGGYKVCLSKLRELMESTPTSIDQPEPITIDACIEWAKEHYEKIQHPDYESVDEVMVLDTIEILKGVRNTPATLSASTQEISSLRFLLNKLNETPKARLFTVLVNCVDRDNVSNATHLENLWNKLTDTYESGGKEEKEANHYKHLNSD